MQYLEQEKKKKRKIENDNQKSIISKEIDGVKTLIIEKEITLDFSCSTRCWEKKNDMSFVKKANAFKRGKNETDDEIKTLQKILVSLEGKRSKMYNYNLEVFSMS